MKRLIIIITIVLLIAGGLFAFMRNKEKISVKLAGGASEDKVAVVATLFPQYDFARAIAGERADITLLLPPGVESHSFEPTPADVAKIAAARVFLYTGDDMEPWAKRLTQSLEKGKKPLVVDVSQGISFLQASDPHDHDHDHASEDKSQDRASGKPSLTNDPHIWTDPNNAMIMTKNILMALVAVDPANEAYYRENAKAYLDELISLDRDLKTVAAAAKQREIIMGGRNAMHYFLKRYGITAHSAFDSCTAEQEPSVKAIAELKDMVRQKEFRVIYFEELREPRIARTLAEGTDAKLLQLHSLHNLSKEDFDAGESYISLMRQNLENLKEGLN